jgi:CHASE3 domain sensor protein
MAEVKTGGVTTVTAGRAEAARAGQSHVVHSGPSGTDSGPVDHPSKPARGGGLLDRLHTTPGRIRVGVALIVLVAIGLGIAIAAVFGGLNSGFTAIGSHDAPLVEQSNALYQSANDMDAQVANVLLTGNDPSLASDRSQDQSIYASDLADAEKDLQQITVAAAADPAAQQAVSQVMNALGRYETLAADAILVNGRGNDQAGLPSSATLSYFQQATDLMANSILPAVQNLTKANNASLTASYNQNRSAVTTGRLITLALGIILIAVLVVLQVFLTRRYHRLVNPLLAAATVIALGLTGAAAVQLGAQNSHLYVAKVEAFDSIQALTQAEATSYDANADESRYLVDPPYAAQYQNDFLTLSQDVASVGTVGIFQYDAALAKDIGAYQANNANVEFGGYLGAEFNNITFPGERAAAVKTLLAYQVYERDDRVLRATAKTNLNGAIAYDIGTNPDQSDGAFNSYTAALGSVITINENAFTTAIQAGHSTGSNWNGAIPAIAVIVIAALAVAGTRRRIAEYR